MAAVRRFMEEDIRTARSLSGELNSILRTVRTTKVSRAKRSSARDERRMHGLEQIAVSSIPVSGSTLYECRTIRSEHFSQVGKRCAVSRGLVPV